MFLIALARKAAPNRGSTVKTGWTLILSARKLPHVYARRRNQRGSTVTGAAGATTVTGAGG